MVDGAGREPDRLVRVRPASRARNGWVILCRFRGLRVPPGSTATPGQLRLRAGSLGDGYVPGCPGCNPLRVMPQAWPWPWLGRRQQRVACSMAAGCVLPQLVRNERRCALGRQVAPAQRAGRGDSLEHGRPFLSGVGGDCSGRCSARGGGGRSASRPLRRPLPCRGQAPAIECRRRCSCITDPARLRPCHRAAHAMVGAGLTADRNGVGGGGAHP